MLEQVLGYQLPIPQQVQPGKEEPARLQALRCWLGLLDRAVTPQMLREVLGVADNKVTEALLRYFVAKHSPQRLDRDKTDLIATDLYRKWRRGSTLSTASVDVFLSPDFSRVPEFAGPLYQVLAEVPLPALPEEHRQLLREFPFLQQEISDFSRFSQLMESDLLQRLREIKEAFGTSLYHPNALAACAECNLALGLKFEELFRTALQDIKDFVRRIELRGGSLSGRVDANVTVEQLMQLDREDLLDEDHDAARPKFHKLAVLSKAVDRSQGPKPASDVAPSGAKPSLSDEEALAERLLQMKERSITRAVANSVRDFIRAAERERSLVVPLRKGSVLLTWAERDAFCVDHAGEESFRGAFATSLVEMVSVRVRLRNELEDLHAKRASAHLWVPHADALAYLVNTVPAMVEHAKTLVRVAEQRGLTDKAADMNSSIESLRKMAEQVAEALSLLSSSPEPASP